MYVYTHTLASTDGRLKAQGPSIADPKIQIMIGPNHDLYITNTSNEDCTFGPAELFGFNTGAFSEMITAKARASKDVLAMVFKADSDLLCAAESGHKQLHSLAGYICSQAGKHGLMDVNVQDHNLEPKLKARFDSIMSPCQPFHRARIF